MDYNLRILEVSSMTPELVDELSELLIQVVNEGASIGFLGPLNKMEAIQYWKEVLQPGVTLWIAWRNDHVVGSIQLHCALKPNASHRAEIAKLMVHPNSRRRGIAQLLMKHAEEKAVSEARTLLVLDTRAGDPSNILYQSLGYIEAGRIPRFAKSSNGEFDATVIYYKEPRKEDLT